ncbi:hypothetical protein CEE37_00440 [candidate division LCP-89 bacterium B3_LCP]|uniref:Secretion system C-terminal sorting domain-containing protein n=1 Tax=candidate division LCP-89 bacterium B3_LCP TaxID=2012998 RepID=A0A532V4S7_UNCL8|nr:MAG: hypothetical protein CEE37_00440 [candidate division LCP-89 bacterium B3_LCP]
MFRRTFILMGVVGIMFVSYAQPPDTLWTQYFGGDYQDQGSSVRQTADDGFIIAGFTLSYGAGYYDAWLVKTDTWGTIIWHRTFGGSDHEHASDVQQTPDGGYIIVGNTASFGAGGHDVWLIKTDSYGFEEWDYTFGEAGNEYGSSVQLTPDGGYIIGGTKGAPWMIKTDANGAEEWNRVFGVIGNATGTDLDQTGDGGYILTGYTQEYGEDEDAFLVKTDINGNEQWTQIYGGTSADRVFSVQNTDDDGYIMAGNTHSFGSGQKDVWLVKTDSAGDTIWTRTFGGSDGDQGECVQQTTDGGYIITGITDSWGAGENDLWLIKTDSLGNEEWNQPVGAEEHENGYSVVQTTDGGYIVTGGTSSYGSGSEDLYLVRVDAENQYIPIEITFEPLYEPIYILPWGGEVGYYINLTNLSPEQRTLDLWIDILLPDTSLYGPVLLREDITLQPSSHLSRLMIQEVPAGAPEGRYINQGQIGDFALQEIWDEDAFAFTKVGYDQGGSGEAIDNWNLSGWDESVETVGFGEFDLPEEFALLGVFPNPFNPTTTISFTLPEPGLVRLEVFDIRGREVGSAQDRPLREGWMVAGQQQITFDGSGLASGIYIYRLTAGEFSASGKMVLMK